MVDSPPDERFETTLGTLEQITSKLTAARGKIEQQRQEIEQLRTLAASAEQAHAAAMVQVKHAIVVINDMRAHHAKAKAKIEIDRSNRMQLADELSEMLQHLGLLRKPVPSGQSISYMQ